METCNVMCIAKLCGAINEVIFSSFFERIVIKQPTRHNVCPILVLYRRKVSENPCFRLVIAEGMTWFAAEKQNIV